MPTDVDGWRELVNAITVREAYGNDDLGAINAWRTWSSELWDANPARPNESESARAHPLFDVMYAVLDRESRLGAALVDLAESGAVEVPSSVPAAPAPGADEVLAQFQALPKRLNDPFLNFDPRPQKTTPPTSVGQEGVSWIR